MSTLIELNPMAARVLPFAERTPRPSPARTEGAELQLLALWALERLDQGILVLSANGAVRFANRCARELLGDGGVLDLSSGLLRAAQERDRAQLQDGLRAAAERGHVRMLRLGSGASARFLMLSGFGQAGGDGPVLGLLGREGLCNPLALQWFAQCHDLTAAETKVLGLLCEGLDPSKVAAQSGVALSTVRSQIGSIRVKTGQESIRSLLHMVGRLPLIRATWLGWCAAAT